MTFAKLAYKPSNICELRALLNYLKKQELKERFAQNTACMILGAMRPKMKRMLYSEYADTLDGTKNADSRTGQEVVDDLKAMLIRRRKKRERRG